MSSSAPTATFALLPTRDDDAPASSCTTAVPDQYGHVPFDACNSYYNYDPQYVPAIASAVIFGVLLAGHIIEAIIFKKKYNWVLCMGALWETVAFILGALGAHDQQNSAFATGHLLLFLLAPLWINAYIYMTLARMIFYYLPDQKVWIIKATTMSKLFVWLDVVTFLVQAAGGSMSTPGADANTTKIGLDVYSGGVGLQEFFILIFAGLMIIFHRKALANDSGSGFQRAVDGQEEHFIPRKGWKAQLYALYTVLALITMRIAYRLAEFVGGVDPTTNPLPFNEVYSYALDAFPMMLALLILLIFNPARILQGPNSDFTEFRREKKQQKKADKAAKKEAKTAAKNGKNYGLIEEEQAIYAPYHYESA